MARARTMMRSNSRQRSAGSDSLPLKTSAGRVATPSTPGKFVLRGIHIPPRENPRHARGPRNPHYYFRLPFAPHDSQVLSLAESWLGHAQQKCRICRLEAECFQLIDPTAEVRK